MKVSELIDKLKTFDPDLEVVTAGFDESGIEPVETLETITIEEMPEGHFSRYEEPGRVYLNRPEPVSQPFLALYIDR